MTVVTDTNIRALKLKKLGNELKANANESTISGYMDVAFGVGLYGLSIACLVQPLGWVTLGAVASVVAGYSFVSVGREELNLARHDHRQAKSVLRQADEALNNGEEMTEKSDRRRVLVMEDLELMEKAAEQSPSPEKNNSASAYSGASVMFSPQMQRQSTVVDDRKEGLTVTPKRML